MSLAIAFKGPEGLVLAADSRVTLNATPAGGGASITVHFDNATKMLSLEGQPFVGIVTYGAGAIGSPEPRTAHGFMPEFEEELSNKHPERATVVQVAEELGSFFTNQWNERGMPAAGTPGIAPLVFLVAGFDEGEAYGKVFEVVVPDRPAPTEQSPGDFGITLGGMSELVQRLLAGVDGRAAALAKDELGLTGAQVQALAARWANELRLSVPYQFLPLQDCVDFSTFMVQMTSAVQGWLVAARGVGGAVEVATITRTEGFKALHQKRIEVRR